MKSKKFAKYIKPFVEAMANGETIQEFVDEEFQDKHNANFIEGMEYRIKQRTIMVNGFEVPEPMREAPKEGVHFWAAQFENDCMVEVYDYDSSDNHSKRYLKLGLCHTTKKAAVAHAKAMLGIDPYAA